jgi:hypothetical protein
MSLVEVNWNPNRRQLRQFAVIWLVGFALFGVLAAWRSGALGGAVPIGWHRPWTAPLTFWIVAIAGGLASLAVPPFALALYRAWMGLAYPIGVVVSHVLLGLIYFVVFSAIGLVFRAIGRDPLHRRFDRGASTYWVKRRPSPGIDRYFKQF